MKRNIRRRKSFWFFLGLACFLIAALSLFLFTLPESKDIQTVLTGFNAPAGKQPLILLTLFAFTMAWVSVAKGYADADAQEQLLHKSIMVLKKEIEELLLKTRKNSVRPRQKRR